MHIIILRKPNIACSKLQLVFEDARTGMPGEIRIRGILTNAHNIRYADDDDFDSAFERNLRFRTRKHSQTTTKNKTVISSNKYR